MRHIIRMQSTFEKFGDPKNYSYFNVLAGFTLAALNV